MFIETKQKKLVTRIMFRLPIQVYTLNKVLIEHVDVPVFFIKQ